MIRCLLLIALLIQASAAQQDPAGGGADPGGPPGGGANPGPGGPTGGGAIPGGKPKPVLPPRKWPTLTGSPPLVIARGGFSGLFPESSVFAVDMALQLTYSDVALFCNLQLTKDNVGICLSDIRLQNATNIGELFANDSKTYKIKGKEVTGWFSKDYTSDIILNNISLIQSVMSRTVVFDGQMPVATVEDIRSVQPPFFWVNVEHDSFYKDHKMSILDYVENTMGLKGVSYISSPEIGFLKKLAKKITDENRLILTFLDQDEVEPTTKKKYSEILKDLKAIKAYASGILVPKDYIWPVHEDKYLGEQTSLLADAHKLGLEVFAAGFANDIPASHNYTQDPTAEYLQFMSDPDISVDGVLTDFSPTASNTIACFISDKKRKKKKVKSLIITNNGASSVYPGCTDLAYERAVKDGADVIDCKVQMTKDGVPFCLDSPDLTGDTTAMPTFMSKSSSAPEIQKDKGIFSFELTWNEIQSLKPQMKNPYPHTGLVRNPEAKHKGKFTKLSDFLGLAKSKKVHGVLVSIENAAYLASKQGLDVIDAVTKTLKEASLDKVQVMIQSDDTSVLSKFKGETAYKRLLRIKDPIGDVSKDTVKEIKKYAEGVVVTRSSLITTDEDFYKKETNVLKNMHAGNLSVYVYVMRNEFVALPFDNYADPVLELAIYTDALGADGVITEFPATASRYMRSPCSNANSDITIFVPTPGALLKEVPPTAVPKVSPPNPRLKIKDVVDPPLPPVTPASDLEPKGSPPAPPKAPSPSSALVVAADVVGVCVAALMALGLLLSMGH